MPKLFLNEDQIAALLSFSKPHVRDHALLHVALATGFRNSDLRNLKRSDVEGVQGEILHVLRVKQQKTGKYVERTLPLTCREAIAFWLGERQDFNPYLFPAVSNNTRGDMVPMSRISVQRIFKRYLNWIVPPEALRGNACHVTRRSVAKIISDRAGRIEPATRFLGHATIAATVHYLDMDGFGKQADEIVQELPWNK